MVIRKLNLFILLHCIIYDLHGQQIFQKNFSIMEPNAHYGIGLIAEGGDSSLYLLGSGYSNIQPDGIRQFIKLNKFGETLWVKTITDDSANVITFNGMTATSNNHLAFYNYRPDTIVTHGLGSVYFSKMAYTCSDTSGNFIWANVMSDSMPFRFAPYNLFKSNDGNILNGLWFFDFGVIDTVGGAMITKLDNNGSIIFRKKYTLNIDGTHDTIFYFTRLVELSDNRLVLCGQIVDTIGNNAGAMLVFLDGNGNILNANMYNSNLGLFTDIALYENNRLLAIATNIIPSTNFEESTVLEIDSTFNIVKSTKLNRVGPTSFSINKIFSSTGRYIFAHSNSFLIEADTSLSTLLNAWYQGNGGGQGVSEKLQCYDGGFCVAAGSITSTFSKVDSTLQPACNLLSSLPYFTISPFSTNYIQNLPVATSVLNSTITPFTILSTSTAINDTFYCRTATAIENKALLRNSIDVKLRPSPAQSYIELRLSENEIYNYEIYNSLGQLKGHGNFKGLSTIIQLSANVYQSGLYYVRVVNRNKIIDCLRFVKL